MNEKVFIPALRSTLNALHKEYENWQYATYKPAGSDEMIEGIIDAMYAVRRLIDRIEED